MGIYQFKCGRKQKRAKIGILEEIAMTLYHNSNTANIKVLKPKQADHDRPYVYSLISLFHVL